MKLNETKPYLESSGELEEHSFGIQDQGMIFDILRNKMYSNSILAICREISCNARDAHREVGIPNVPIHIHLPNNIEPYFKIKDFGPGISRDRMINIFIKYTASTKRNDNLQTGGFGLGAKTPFSYSDTFSIITIHDGIRYNYNCVIDETKIGKIMLTSQSPTKEKNGTEIIIPVIPKNFNDFGICTEQACRHWEVKPEIKGGTIQWQESTFILEGDNWAIANSHYNNNRNSRMIIDGIEYPFDFASLRNYADTKLIDAAKGYFIMYFGVGELSLSASRESIYLDDRTKSIIRNRLEAICQSIRQKAVEKINCFDNLWDANLYYNLELSSAFNNIQFLGQLTWKNLPLTSNGFNIGCSGFLFTRGKHSSKYGTDLNKISRSSNTYIRFEKNAVIYINDLGIKEPTPKNLKKAFEDDANLKLAYVICPTDSITFDVLNNKLHLEKMGVKFLSTITKATKRAYIPHAERLVVFKFDKDASSFRQVSYASVDEDKSTKILCDLKCDSYRGNRTAIMSKGHLDCHAIITIMNKYPNHTFYGLNQGYNIDRVKKDFCNFISAEKFIQEKVINNKSIDYTKIKFAIINKYNVDDKMHNVKDTMNKLIKDPGSIFFLRQAIHEKIREIAKTDKNLLDIYQLFNGEINKEQLQIFTKKNPNLDILNINILYNKKYPLMQFINTCINEATASYMANYINLIDKENKNV